MYLGVFGNMGLGEDVPPTLPPPTYPQGSGDLGVSPLRVDG